jgi:hypothetical protein
MAMLADAAAVADGKLYVHGGGWDVIYTPAVPATHPMLALVFVVEFERSEVPLDRTLRVSLRDEDDTPLDVAAVGALRAERPPGRAHDAPMVQLFALPFPTITFPRAARYYFSIGIDETELARVRFDVRTPPTPGPAESPEPPDKS